MSPSTKTILLSLLGILSLLASIVFAIGPSGFNVHSGEIIIYLFLLLAGFIVVPVYLFLRSVRIIKLLEREDKQSLTQKVAIVLTAVLGLGLGAEAIGIIWIIVVPQ